MDIAQYLSGDPKLLLDGDLSMPELGIQAKLEYKGDIINQAGVVDRVFIKSISGLGDPDLRLVNESNPGAHGETPFDSFYGGRTLTLNGQIEAAKFSKLETMKRGLKAMFNDLTEGPLVFRTGDPARDVMINCRKGQPMAMDDQQDGFYIKRPFQIFLRASDPRFVSYIEENRSFNIGFADANFADLTKYTFVSGQANVSVVGGDLTATGSAGVNRRIVYNGQNFLDPKVSTGVQTPTPGAGQSYQWGHMAKYVDANNHVYANVQRDSAGVSTLVLQVTVGGTNQALSFDSQTAAQITGWSNNSLRWMRSTMIGNVLTVQLWTGDPDVGGSTMIHTATKTLTGTAATALGTGVSGKGGPSAAWIGSDSTALVKILTWRVAENGAFAGTIFTVPNKGDWLAEPTIKIYGPVNSTVAGGTAATITNNATGQSITIKSPAGSTTAVPSNAYLKIDTRDTGGRKIQEFLVAGDSLVGNRFDRISIDSDMIKLQPGNNAISVNFVTGTVTRIDMAYRHTFL